MKINVSLSFALTNLLVQKGFEHVCEKEWVRDEIWKSDLIMIDSRLPSSEEYLASMLVRIPLLDGTKTPKWPYQYLDQINVPSVLGKKNIFIPMPFFKFRKKIFIQRFCADIEIALQWFELYKTPKNCLSRLSNIKIPGSDAYNDAKLYLTSQMDPRAIAT
jgi:hypothetical protein